jgi:hypothetical protein
MKFLIGLIAFGSLSASALPTAVTGKSVKDSSPVSVEIGEKKGLVAVFFSTKCPCSNSHLEEVRKLSQEYPEFAFVGIHSNTDEGQEQTQAYFKNADLPFPVIQDTGAKLANEFRASKTPHAFIVLKSGETAFQGGASDSKDCGSATKKYLRAALDDLHSGRKVKEPYVRTLGCAIARGGKNVW